MITPEQLAEIDALTEKATPGPWSTGFHEIHKYYGQNVSTFEVAGWDMCWIAKVQEHRSCSQTSKGNVNGEFIAAARTNVPLLTAEIRRLRAEVKRLTNR